MKFREALVLGAGICLLLLAARSAEGSVIHVMTPVNASVDGQPVAAEAIFATSANHISITLTNLQNDPTSVSQALSSLRFSLSTGQSSGTLVSSQAQERTIASKGKYTDGKVVSTGWVLSVQNQVFDIDDLAGKAAGPAHTLLGNPGLNGLYGSANASIAGNKPHNAFLAGSATFELCAPGVTEQTAIDNMWFGYGTSGSLLSGGSMSQAPEPASLAVLTAGGLLALRRRR